MLLVTGDIVGQCTGDGQQEEVDGADNDDHKHGCGRRDHTRVLLVTWCPLNPKSVKLKSAKLRFYCIQLFSAKTCHNLSKLSYGKRILRKNSSTY